MAEPTPEKAKLLGELLANRYNRDHNTDFRYAGQVAAGNDCDLLLRSTAGDELRVQHVEAVPTRGKELSALKRFEKDGGDCGVVHVQTSEMRVREALGHKKASYPSETRRGLILLIDFGLLPWRQDELQKMQSEAASLAAGFQGVYCVHDGGHTAERLG